jgi:hypothetical protein
MIDEQFLQTIPQYGIGGFVGKIFKKVKDTVKKVAPIAGAGIGFLIGGAAGAGIGSGIGSLIAGKSPQEALQAAALGYGVGSLAGVTPGLKGFAGKGIPFTSGWEYGTDTGTGFGAMGDKYNLFNMFGGGTEDKITKLEGQNIALEEAAAAGNTQAVDQIAINNKAIENLKVNEIIKSGGTIGGGKLGNILTAGSLALPAAAYMGAQQEAANFVPPDPQGLNQLYYEDPQAFQIANLGVDPYYYSDLQDQFGVPVSDLPTNFLRAAQGGTVKLADGSEQYFPRKNGQIDGPGTGTSDDIPAMLSDGEFVFTAKAVRNAGGGDRREGAKRMYQVMKNLEKGGNLSMQSRGVA